MDQYAELSWSEFMYKPATASSVSKDDFITSLAQTLNEKFDLPVDDITGLFTNSDSHNTDDRTRATWKYSAALGMSGTPQAQLNGVTLDNYPASADEWKDLFKEIYPATEEMFL